MSFLDSFTKYAPGIDAISGIASTIGGMLGSIGQGKRQRKIMDYQYELNKRMYEQQRDDNLQMYQRQLADQKALIADERAYNDFSSVSARARKAGVNPLAIFDNGGVGIQSSAGSTPSYNAPSAGSSSIPSPDNIGANLISGGATISNIIRSSALLDAEIKSAQAEARIKEVKAFWADRSERADVEDKEWSAKLKEANAGASEANRRLLNLKGDLAEQEKNFKDSYNPALLDQMQVSLDMSKEEFQHLQFKTSTQQETYKLYVKTQEAHIYEVYQSIKAKFDELDLRGEELGLSKRQLDEVRAQRHQVDRHFKRTQDWKEKMDKKNFTKDVVLGSINSFSGLLSSCSGALNALGNCGLNLMTFGM